MRAAIAIVGAIAVASILIALALVLSGSSNSGATVTRTVTEEIVRAPKSLAEGEEGVVAHLGGPQECEGGAFTVENVTCEVGSQIREDYDEGGRHGLLAEDEKAGETITMSCRGTAPIECKGPGDAKVYFGG